MSELIVDPEFKALIPPLGQDEYSGLENSLIREGFQQKIGGRILLWNGIIVDGHNRYEICHRNNIPFKTADMEFESRDDVIEWIYTNQLARRNITDQSRTYLIGKQYDFRKKREGAIPKYLNISELRQSDVVTKDLNISNASADEERAYLVGKQYEERKLKQESGKIDIKTAAKIAEEQQVSSRTVERAAAYSRAVDTIESTTGIDAVKQKILSGSIKTTKQDIVNLASVKPEIQKEVMTKILDGKETNIKSLLNEQYRKQKIEERTKAVELQKPTSAYGLIKNLDCLDYLKSIDSESVDLVLTDPPYEISRETGFKEMTANGVQRLGVSMKFGKWDEPGAVDLNKTLIELFRVLRKGGTAIIFYDLWKLSAIREMMEQAGFKQIRFIEWIKTNPVPLNSKINYLTNAREIAVSGIKGSNPKFHSEYDNGVYSYPIYQSKHRFHPTQKPVELFCDLIKKHSDEGDVVLDAFLGSGTTAIASMKTNRICEGCEIDPDMYSKMIDRIEEAKHGK